MTPLLERIDKPQDLHGLTDEELQLLAQEVREHIIDTVGEIGGHFGANLGTCEIAVALHSMLDSPRDKILWDVGHQAYPHKILTGRRDRLHTIRKYGGLAPFCSISESEHDIMGAGHASTAIGYAVGIKEAMRPGPRRGRPRGRRGRRRRDDRRGGLRGGPPGRRRGHADRRRAQRQRDVDRAQRRRAVALLQPRPPEPEAVARPRGRRGRPDQAAGRHRRRVRAARPALQGVDQGVLGSRAVVGGARLRLHRRDRRPRRARAAPRAARGAGRRAAGRRPLARRSRARASRPPRRAASRAWRSGTPPSRSRSPTARRRSSARASRPRASRRRPSTRRCSARRCVRRVPARRARDRDHRRDELGHRPRTSSSASCPTATSTSASPSSRRCCSPPGSRSRAASPSCAIYSTFLQRAYDQIVHDVCLQKLNVVFAMDRAGLVGDDGPTHHGAFDIAYLRCLPNIVLMAPRDEAMLVHMLHTALAYDDGPVGAALPARRGVGVPLPGAAASRSRSAPARSCARATRVALLGYGTRRRQGARGGRHPRRARHVGDGRRRALRQADRRRAGSPSWPPSTSCS